MLEVVFNTPALYGDHHVIEVRRILLALPGIQQVYASSCFHVIEVSFDPTLVTQGAISDCLAQAGYLDPFPVEGEPGLNNGLAIPTRRTTAGESSVHAIAFAQQTRAADREAWPCPGMGLLHPQS